jgi:hypothetical protein
MHETGHALLLEAAKTWSSPGHAAFLAITCIDGTVRVELMMLDLNWAASGLAFD